MVARAMLGGCAFALAALFGPTDASAALSVPNILANEHVFVGEAGVEAPPFPRAPSEFARDLAASKITLARTLRMVAARGALMHRDLPFEYLARRSRAFRANDIGIKF